MENKSQKKPLAISDSTAVHITTNSNLYKFMLLLVLAITLTVGLLPRGSFDENWLEWNESASITDFGTYGIVHGSFPDLTQTFEKHHQLVFDFVIVPKPFVDSEFRILLQIDSLSDPQPFVIGQWENYLIVLQGRDFANKERRPRLTADISEFMGEELNVTVKLNNNRNELFLNERLVNHHSPSIFELSKNDGRLIIGNSPIGKPGWFGGVKKFDVFLLDISTKQTEVVRRYDFSSSFTDEILDLSINAAHLKIPQPGNFPNKRFLQNTDIDDLISFNKFDLFINFLGFGPLGFFVAIVLRQASSRSRVLLPLVGAVAVGCLVSLGIELSQPMIPGRNSHMHDLVLNVLGAACGGFALIIFASLVKLFTRTETSELRGNV